MGRTDHRLRMVALLLVFALFASAAGLRLGHLQVVEAPALQQRLTSRATAVREDPVIRGSITDRNGVVLAHTGFQDRLAAWPRNIPASRRAAVADELATILGLEGRARDELERALANGSSYAVLARQVSVEQSREIREAFAEGRVTGVVLEPQQVRVYPNPGGQPNTSLASQLLGFVTADGIGRYGVEQRYDDVLAGRGGLVASVALPGGAGLAPSDAGLADVEGQEVRLTIDAGLQLALEKQLYHAWVLNKAERVSGIVLDPYSGEVLAWASVPGYDANRFTEVWRRDRELFADPIASGVYEPGSVMKAFTAAAALSSGRFKPRTRIRDTAVLRLDGRQVRNADHKAMGPLRLDDVIAYSRNVATAKVALRLEATRQRSAVRLFRTWQDLGLGKPTGIDIAGEARGLVTDPRKRRWTDLDLANRAFGQGVATTQVQLAVAYAAMVNGGFRVRPHLLVSDTDERSRGERVLSPKVANQMRTILRRVTGAVPWYAEGSLIRGYEVGGKTGTAQIWDRRQGRYLPRTFDFSFVGYVGSEKPEAVIAVRIHRTRPKVIAQGVLELQITSFELFRRIAMDVIRVVGIPRSKEPGAGFPLPRSHAERVLFPDRYAASTGRADRAGSSAAAGGQRRATRAQPRPGQQRASRDRPAAGG
jgi:cell division protein FtsI (penicillin-binding protein 3)